MSVDGMDRTEQATKHFVVPPLHTARVALREVRPNDYGFLYELSTSPGDAFRWRFRGAQPGYEQFVQTLRQEVHCMYIIDAIPQEAPLGVVACYRADFRNQNAFVAVQGRREVQFKGVLMEGLELFVDFLFGAYDFQKLYAECPEFNMGEFRSGIGDAFQVEGIFRRHERFLGEWWDLFNLAVYRDEWVARAARLDAQHALIAPALAHDASGSGVSFERFVETVFGALDVDVPSITGQSHLVEDLGFDSIMLYELVDLLETTCGPLSPGAIADMSTVDDVYFHFAQAGPRHTG